MDIQEFEKFVHKVIITLPAKFKRAIDNVNVVVEDWPRPEVAQGRLLLGLYQGVPKTTWGRHQGLQVPDKITIFRGPITFLSGGNPAVMKKLIIETVEHEIAHHFGIGDERLNQIKR